MFRFKRCFPPLASSLSSLALALFLAGCPEPGSPPTSADFVVITTTTTVEESTQLDPFLRHKESLGYRVHVETVEAIESNDPEGQRADKIRRWLQERYSIWGIQHVLLIGSPDPDDGSPGDLVGSVPMKMTWPAPGADCPTDFYYAELTEDWNLDGDDRAGEFFDDFGGSDPDLAADLLVGRIPSDEPATIDTILEKTIGYELDSRSAWRRSVLLANSWPHAATDGSEVGHAIEEIADAAGYRTWTFWQQETVSTGTSPVAADSFHDSDADLVEGAVVNEWFSRPYGVVALSGHGNPYAMSIGNRDTGSSGRMIHADETSVLDDSRPAFVILGACSTAQPETSDNLAHRLLSNGSIAVVAATRTTSGQRNITDFSTSNTPAGFTYGVSTAVVEEGGTLGSALSDFRSAVDCPDGRKLKNVLAFNFYGDPSVEWIAP